MPSDNATSTMDHTLSDGPVIDVLLVHSTDAESGPYKTVTKFGRDGRDPIPAGLKECDQWTPETVPVNLTDMFKTPSFQIPTMTCDTSGPMWKALLVDSNQARDDVHASTDSEERNNNLLWFDRLSKLSSEVHQAEEQGLREWLENSIIGQYARSRAEPDSRQDDDKDTAHLLYYIANVSKRMSGLYDAAIQYRRQIAEDPDENAEETDAAMAKIDKAMPGLYQLLGGFDTHQPDTTRVSIDRYDQTELADLERRIMVKQPDLTSLFQWCTPMI